MGIQKNSLTKMDFVEDIYENEMKNINFSEFHLVFDIIRKISE